MRTTCATVLGRYQLGDFVPLTFSAVDNNGTPAWPTATPTVKTYDASDVTSAVETIRPPAHDMQRLTGLFRYLLRLGSSYAADKTYVAVATWAISDTTYGNMFQWDVLAGGDADGAVIGATFISRPEAGVVAYVVDGGNLKTSNNPR